eukprot:TCALIF_09160-PA protein Name:"Protein of unknown function" AED:0.26 eAED:0.04 QI:8/0.88/0.7/0.9/0.44/0.6/10/0/1441
MLVWIFLFAVLATANDEESSKVLETFSRQECPKNYEYCTKRHQCLSVLGCRTNLGVGDCPQDFEICDPIGQWCWKKDCQDVQEPCSVLCDKKLVCPRNPDGPAQCYEVIECQSECEEGVEEAFELPNRISTEEYYEYPEFPSRIKRQDDEQGTTESQNGEVSIDTKEMDACPPGTAFCSPQGLCLPECPTQEDQCPDGTIFCLETKSCQSDCPTDNEHKIIQCPEGSTYCLSNNRCSMNCEELAQESQEQCPPGLTFCLDIGGCSQLCHEGHGQEDPQDRSEVIECPSGMYFCLDRGLCLLDCNDEVVEIDQEGEETIVQCPSDMMFCMDRGLCSYDCTNDEILPVQLPLDDNFQCPLGMTFCLDRGQCLMDCNDVESGGNTNHDEVECPRGLTFCLDSGLCTTTCNEARPKKCPSGTIYCPKLNKCATHCTNHGATELDQNFIRCPSDTVFCLERGRCLSNCNEKNRPSTNTDDNNNIRECPQDMVFCLDQGMCVLECNSPQNETNSTNETHQCPIGMTLCSFQGMCSWNCSVPEIAPLNTSLEYICLGSTAFCRNTRRCESNCTAEFVICPSNQTFCNATKTCGADCSDFREVEEQCPMGQVFCLESGSCRKSIEDCSAPSNPNDILESCPTGTVFCLSQGGCIDECKDELQKCPDGTSYCMTTGLCGMDCPDEITGPRCPEGTDICNENESDAAGKDNPGASEGFIKCPPNTIYCLEAGECLTECKSPKNPLRPQCPLGMTLCMGTSECRSECSEQPTSPPDSRQIVSCPIGTHFCMEQMSCQVDCSDQSPSSPSPVQDEWQCPKGTSLCLDIGTCSADCDSQRHPIQLDVDYVCPPGTAYCLSQGLCTSSCQDDGEEEKEEEKQNEKPIRETTCPPGTTFCLESNQCLVNCIGESSLSGINSIFQCPPGMIYCLESQQCATDCRDDKNFGLEQDWAGRHSSYKPCPRGYIYCLAIDACVLGDCSVFESRHPNCTSNQVYNPLSKSCETFHNFDSNRTYVPYCGEGKYFCGITDDCLSMSEPCDQAFCPWGTVLCNGQCSRSCSFEDVGCPTPKSIETPKFTSCMVNHHCEAGYLCCKDSAWRHRHCVKTGSSNSTSLVSLPGAMALQQSCTAIALPRNAFLLPDNQQRNCSGLDSTDEPWKCPSDTLCCEGTCWGLPSYGRMGNSSSGDNEDEIRGPAKQECSGRDIYCPLLEKCLAFHQLNECSKSCPEGQNLCQNGTKTFKCSAVCSDEEAISRIWITSKATGTRNDSDPLSLKLLVEEYGDASNEWTEMVVISSDMGWEFRDSFSSSSTWQKLEKGSILSRESWLQYKAEKNLSSSGSLNTSESTLRKFKMKLEGSPNQRDWLVTLAQLELPLLPTGPILAGNSKSTHNSPKHGVNGEGRSDKDNDDHDSSVEKVYYAMKEDSREPVRLSDVFMVLEDPMTISILRREYQRCKA